MNDLKRTIMGALADAGIDHDDLDLLSDQIEAAIRSGFRVARRQDCDLAARLDSLQQAILDGQEDPHHLRCELQALRDRVAAALEDASMRAMPFEDMERLRHLERKLAYLDDVLDRLVCRGDSAYFEGSRGRYAAGTRGMSEGGLSGGGPAMRCNQHRPAVDGGRQERAGFLRPRSQR